jgi:hypothetical protein
MSQAHFGALPQYGNIMVKTGQLESTNRPSEVKPMRILQDSIFHKHTLFFLGHRNDFLSLRTVFVLKLPEMHILICSKLLVKESNQRLINSVIAYQTLL